MFAAGNECMPGNDGTQAKEKKGVVGVLEPLEMHHGGARQSKMVAKTSARMVHEQFIDAQVSLNRTEVSSSSWGFKKGCIALRKCEVLKCGNTWDAEELGMPA